MKVAFIGLGNMGTPLARHLIHAGHDVTVWNRTQSKAERLRAAGARMGASAGEAAKDAAVVITMLADDSAVESAVLHPGGVLETEMLWPAGRLEDPCVSLKLSDCGAAVNLVVGAVFATLMVTVVVSTLIPPAI